MQRLVALLTLVASSLLLVPLLLAFWLPEGRELDAASDERGRSAESLTIPQPPDGTITRTGERESIAWQTLLLTVAVAFAAAVMAVVVGLLLASLFELTDLPGSPWWSTATLISFVCPATVWALMQLYCYGPGGLMERWLGGIWRQFMLSWPGGSYLATSWVLAQIHVPLAMLILGRGLARWHHGGVESAWLGLSPWRFCCWFIGLMRGELTTAFGLTFALSATSFAVPHVLQCRLYVIEIYLRAANYLDHASAMRMAWPLLGVTCLAAGLAAWGESPWKVDGRERQVARRLTLGPWRWCALGAVIGYLSCTTFLPLLAIVVECRSWTYFQSAILAADLEVANSVRLGLGVAAVIGLISFCLLTQDGWLRSLPGSVVGLLPLGVPSLLIGLAYLRCASFFLPHDFTLLDSTPLLIMLGLTCRAWPFAIRLARLGRHHVAPVWEEAAQAAGLSRLQYGYRIQLPLLFDHGLGAAVVAFLVATSDVELSQLLCAPGQGTLALRLFTFLHFGPTHVAASLALLLILLCLVPLAAYALLCQRLLRLI